MEEEAEGARDSTGEYAAKAFGERGRGASRALLALLVVALVAGAAATTAWAVLTAKVRPLDGVEGEILFEAARIRARWSLYVDPIVGTSDTPPSRFYALYPPLWSALLSRFAEWAAPLAGRAIAGGAFILSLGLAAKRSRVGWIAVGFALGSHHLASFAAAARPDSLALLVATLGLALTIRKGTVSALPGALFALAVLIKPNVMGIAAGVIVVSAFTNPRATLGALSAGLIVGLLGFAALSVIGGSDGKMPTFLLHLMRSTAQPPSLPLWREHLVARAPYFAAPLLIALVYVFPVQREPRVRVAFGALVVSTLWAFASLSKIGSASNYFMEPAVAAVAAVTIADRVRGDVASRMKPLAVALAAVLLLGQAGHNALAAAKSAYEEIPAALARRRALDWARGRCLTSPTAVVIADEPGIEVELNGRLVWTPFQMTHLFERGRLPREPWLADLARPEVRCVLMQRDELERDYGITHRRIDPDIKRAVLSQFERDVDFAPPDVARRSGFFVYKKP